MRARSSRPFCSCEGRPGKPVVISRRVQVHGRADGSPQDGRRNSSMSSGRWAFRYKRPPVIETVALNPRCCLRAGGSECELSGSECELAASAGGTECELTTRVVCEPAGG